MRWERPLTEWLEQYQDDTMLWDVQRAAFRELEQNAYDWLMDAYSMTKTTSEVASAIRAGCGHSAKKDWYTNNPFDQKAPKHYTCLLCGAHLVGATRDGEWGYEVVEKTV